MINLKLTNVCRIYTTKSNKEFSRLKASTGQEKNPLLHEGKEMKQKDKFSYDQNALPLAWNNPPRDVASAPQAGSLKTTKQPCIAERQTR